jgi:hypothetical protein
MGMRFIDGYTTEQANSADEFEFPDPNAPTLSKTGKKSANATDLDATNLSAVELTPEELAAKQAKQQADLAALAAANVTAPLNATNGTNATAPAPGKSAAAARAAPAGAGALAAAALCVLAALL